MKSIRVSHGTVEDVSLTISNAPDGEVYVRIGSSFACVSIKELIAAAMELAKPDLVVESAAVLGRRWGPRHSHGSSMAVCYCANYRNPDAFEAHAGSPVAIEFPPRPRRCELASRYTNGDREELCKLAQRILRTAPPGSGWAR